MFPAASPEAAIAPAAKPASNTDAIAAAVIVLAYAAVQIVLFAGHAPWRDEAQAWLWAQSLASPTEFLVVPGEGHPPLWFWLLRGLSTVIDFNQARYLTLGIALLNALLLARLVRGEVLLLTLMLCTHVVMQYWGYHFRPYGLVFTCLLSALLFERAGRIGAATWVLAIACGLHFFAGVIFGFWLLVQLRRDTPIRQLIAPAVLAALFGISAILSGLGNPEGEPTTKAFFEIVVFNLAWPVPWPDMRQLPVAAVTIGLICYGLWHAKFMLGVLLSLMLVFAIGSAVFYGQSPWHSAFMMMLTFVAFMLAGTHARRWVLMLLLSVQAVAGVAVSKERALDPSWTRPDIYGAILADAGPDFDPASQLVGWQDFMLSPTAAVHGIVYRSGNNGDLLGPVDWRRRVEDNVDPILATHPTPYWLVCGQCIRPLLAIFAADLTATNLATTVNFDDGRITAYRIDK